MGNYGGGWRREMAGGEERSTKDPTGAGDTNLWWLQPTKVWQVSDAKEDGWKKLTGY